MSKTRDASDEKTVTPDTDNNLGRGAPADRSERVRQLDNERSKLGGQSEGEAERHLTQEGVAKHLR